VSLFQARRSTTYDAKRILEAEARQLDILNVQDPVPVGKFSLHGKVSLENPKEYCRSQAEVTEAGTEKEMQHRLVL